MRTTPPSGPAPSPGPRCSWLEADLTRNAATPTFVFMHKPFWALGVAAGEPDPMHDLFVRAGVLGVFTGHWHNHLHARIDGIDYTGVGSSGGVTAGLPHPRRGNVPEFVEATVRGRDLSLTTVIRGQEYPVDYLSVRDQALLRKLHRGAVTGRLVPIGSDSASLALHVENLGDAPLRGVLTVDGGAWSVGQPSVALDVAPGAIFEATIPVARGTAEVPLPRIRLDMPLPGTTTKPSTSPPAARTPSRPP